MKSIPFLVPDDWEDVDLALSQNLPAFFSALAYQFRSGTEATENFWRDIQENTGLPRDKILQRCGLILRIGIELFAFYLIFWELKIQGENYARR